MKQCDAQQDDGGSGRYRSCLPYFPYGSPASVISPASIPWQPPSPAVEPCCECPRSRRRWSSQTRIGLLGRMRSTPSPPEPTPFTRSTTHGRKRMTTVHPDPAPRVNRVCVPHDFRATPSSYATDMHVPCADRRQTARSIRIQVLTTTGGQILWGGGICVKPCCVMFAPTLQDFWVSVCPHTTMCLCPLNSKLRRALWLSSPQHQCPQAMGNAHFGGGSWSLSSFWVHSCAFFLGGKTSLTFNYPFTEPHGSRAPPPPPNFDKVFFGKYFPEHIIGRTYMGHER